MLSLGEIVSVAAMVCGFLLQNYSEWRAGGPRYPETGGARRLLPPAGDCTRLLAVILVSAIVIFICLLSVALDAAWLVVAVAAALIVNAIAQLVGSFFTKSLLPGTLAGLIFMMPPSLWVIKTLGDGTGWLPIAIGPLLSVPLLVGIWWLAAFASHRIISKTHRNRL
ncbi:HXXEE domain-containing protein [Paracoccus onubensis]|uniref:HXXEE domain-containing protein n=1 Tax=Paracoccus onubensis TaxID=1675788 RepID=A0A418SWZ4_9RHOB|nr:HXXEE domain-containing protein [Paracoccus onubensis]RJE85476.1 HXXEE domain-containing protein [Paracoccus onubensis]